MCVHSFSTEMNISGGEKVEIKWNKVEMGWLKYLFEAMLNFFLLVMLKNAATRFLILLPIENGFDHKKTTSTGFFYLALL